ncbi:MAG TPA: thioredoxin family protein [Cytophagales bacterium]|nr:thioredoxin family protein [Cytophagales bacterium]
MKKLIIMAATAAVATFSAFTLGVSPGYKVGDKARDFKLKSVENKQVSLADFDKAKGYIVVFTCNHCPFAVKYEDRINALNKKYADQGYPVVAINPNDSTQHPEDSFENMKKRAQEKSFTFPYLLDETQDIAKTYGALKTPHVYVLKKEKGDLIVSYIGAIDDNTDNAAAVKEKYVEQAVDALLAGKAVKVTSTKAIGCGIKWKQ